LQADLLVIPGDRKRPYQALIEAQASDVWLVLIGGQPVLGTLDLVRSYWNRNDPELSEVSVDGMPKVVMLPMPDSSLSVSDLLSRLQGALISQGTELAPLSEGR